MYHIPKTFFLYFKTFVSNGFSGDIFTDGSELILSAKFQPEKIKTYYRNSGLISR